MPIVTLKSNALLSIQQAKGLEQRKREFHLARVDDKGNIQHFIPMQDIRLPKRSYRPHPAYYPLDIQLDIPQGIYMVMAGERPTMKRYYLVGATSITQIPDPSHAVVML